MRYVIHPGYVISKYDRQRHFVTFSQLAALYGVNPADCIDGGSAKYREQAGDIPLRPRYHGDYTLPANIAN